MHAIQQMFDAEIKMRHAEITWQTRYICSFIANTVEDQKSREQMVESANKISLLPDQEVADTKEDTRSLEEIMEHGNVEEALRRNSERKGPGLPF